MFFNPRYLTLCSYGPGGAGEGGAGSPGGPGGPGGTGPAGDGGEGGGGTSGISGSMGMGSDAASLAAAEAAAGLGDVDPTGFSDADFSSFFSDDSDVEAALADAPFGTIASAVAFGDEALGFSGDYGGDAEASQADVMSFVNKTVSTIGFLGMALGFPQVALGAMVAKGLAGIVGAGLALGGALPSGEEGEGEDTGQVASSSSSNSDGAGTASAPGEGGEGVGKYDKIYEDGYADDAEGDEEAAAADDTTISQASYNTFLSHLMERDERLQLSLNKLEKYLQKPEYKSSYEKYFVG